LGRSFGGIAQFAAGLWAYRARDALATAMHGMWGAFWMAYGILWLLVAAGDLTLPAGKFPEPAFWFFPLAAITLSGMLASIGRVVLPLGVPYKQANIPGAQFTRPLEYHWGEPGVRQGQ
jgi:hypothetical protein